MTPTDDPATRPPGDEWDEDWDDDDGQPTGSCDECGADLYTIECDEEGGLCGRCYWQAE